MQLRKKNHIISQEFISFEDNKKTIQFNIDRWKDSEKKTYLIFFYDFQNSHFYFLTFSFWFYKNLVHFIFLKTISRNIRQILLFFPFSLK